MFISKLSFATFPLLIDRPCHLEPFISLICEAEQQGEITERVSTMPLYEMVIERLAGIGAWYVHINPATEACGSGEKSPACEDGLFFNDLRMISL